MTFTFSLSSSLVDVLKNKLWHLKDWGSKPASALFFFLNCDLCRTSLAKAHVPWLQTQGETTVQQINVKNRQKYKGLRTQKAHIHGHLMHNLSVEDASVKEEGREVLVKEETRAVATLRGKGKEGPSPSGPHPRRSVDAATSSCSRTHPP